MTSLCLGLTIFAPDFFDIARVGRENTLFIIILILVSGYIISLFSKILDKINIGSSQQVKISSWVDQQVKNNHNLSFPTMVDTRNKDVSKTAETQAETNN